MNTDVINGVPRELLEQIEALLALLPEAKTIERVRALLATAQPADHSEHSLNMAAQPAADGEREAFEAEILGHREGADLSRKPDGSYSNYYLECVWQGYQMRAALSPAGGGVVMPERKTCDDGYPSDDWLAANAWNSALDAVARLNAKPKANSQEGE